MEQSTVSKVCKTRRIYMVAYREKAGGDTGLRGLSQKPQLGEKSAGNRRGLAWCTASMEQWEGWGWEEMWGDALSLSDASTATCSTFSNLGFALKPSK